MGNVCAHVRAAVLGLLSLFIMSQIAAAQNSSENVSPATTQSTLKSSQPIKVTSPNFILMGRMNAAFASSLMSDLEVFRAAVLDMFDGPESLEDEPITIYLITDRGVYDIIAPFEGSSAFYTGTILGPMIVVNGAFHGADSQALRHSLFHEYMHHLNKRHLGYNIPVWFNEGLAEYYATFEHSTDGQYLVGQRQQDYFYALEDTGWTPIVTLFNALHDYPALDHARSRAALDRQQSFFYAQSWLITHYLKNSPDGISKLRQFFERMDPQRDSEIAFEQVFDMTYWEFEDRLKAYLAADNFPLERVEPTREMSTVSPVVTSMDPGAFRAEQYRLLSYYPNAPDFETRRNKIRADIPTTGETGATVHIIDAVQLIVSQNILSAKDSIDLARREYSEHPQLHTISVLVDFLIWQEDFGKPSAKLRQDLRKAIADNPGRHDFQIMLISTYAISQRQKLPEDILKLVDNLLAARFDISDPSKAMALVPYLRVAKRYDDIERILDSAEVWQPQAALRSSARRTRIDLSIWRTSDP